MSLFLLVGSEIRLREIKLDDSFMMTKIEDEETV